MSLLGRPLRIRDVRDVEAFQRDALRHRLGRWGARLEPDDFDDALIYLIALAWELEQQFDDSLGVSFSTYLFRLSQLRIADWYRARFGDSRYGGHPADLIDPHDPGLEQIPDTTTDRLIEREEMRVYCGA